MNAAAPTPDATASVVDMLRDQGESLAIAESLTGGLLAAAITDVPGASNVFRGSITAYATDLKAELLGVPTDLLARVGAVDPDVAVAMATGVRDRLGASYGLATTGVAGPDEQDGKAVGTVYVALAHLRDSQSVVSLSLSGDRRAIREAATREALELLRRRLEHLRRA